MRYEKYSPSIIRWNHQFPSHWSCEKAKRFFANPKRLNKENGERNILSLTLRGVIRNDGDKPIGLSPSDYSTYQIFYPGELVFKLIDLNNISTSRVGLVPEKGIMSSAYIRFAPREDMNIKYFYYQYFDWYKRNIFNGLGEGVRQTLSGTDLMNLEILVPPRAEQDLIVRYLDWQVSKINKLIAAKKKQIISLTAKKQIMASDVITHGLNPKAEMKFSGVKWLGNVPNHWQVRKIASLFTQRNVKVSDKDYPALSVAKMGIVPQLDTAVKTNAGDNRKLVCNGDFVINSRSDRKGSCGVAKQDGSVSLINIVLTPRQEWSSHYVHYLLRSQPFSEEYYRYGRGIVADLWTTRYNEMKNIMLPVPPLDEQAQIAHWLDEHTQIIEEMMSALNKEIDTLHELRTRLISDVVTGQIDVRGIVVPDFTMVEETNESVAEDDISEETEGQED